MTVRPPLPTLDFSPLRRQRIAFGLSLRRIVAASGICHVTVLAIEHNRHRLPHEIGTILRAIVVPFLLGLAVFPLACTAGDMGSGFLGGRLGDFFTVMLVGSMVVGFIASAAAGRDHGWLGYRRVGRRVGDGRAVRAAALVPVDLDPGGWHRGPRHTRRVHHPTDDR